MDDKCHPPGGNGEAGPPIVALGEVLEKVLENQEAPGVELGDLRCVNCGKLLFRFVWAEEQRAVVIKCGRCGESQYRGLPQLAVRNE